MAWKFIAGINGYVYSGADNTSSLGVLSLKDSAVTRIYTETGGISMKAQADMSICNGSANTGIVSAKDGAYNLIRR